MRWFQGVPSPVKHPELVDMVIFRENTEGIYAGLEVEAMTPDALKLRELLEDAFGWQIREDAGIGIKPIPRRGHSASSGLPCSTPWIEVAPGPLGTQGQHHEVHRRCLPEVGIRTRS
ncbi:MAG: hypothetical protein Ct9H300mP12_16130 [Acidimicrobiales bacterium]|nr:MAG: hypothetical protein Ct9H300mP12_16130 [Acidimicrobiales bacterium]